MPTSANSCAQADVYRCTVLFKKIHHSADGNHCHIMLRNIRVRAVLCCYTVTSITHMSLRSRCAVCNNASWAAGEAQRRRPSFRQWFSSAPHRPPAAQHAASARPPAASRQRTSSTREQRRNNPPPRSTHNTEWRWNLGGPSTGGSSAGAYQVPRLPAHLAGGNSGSASGSSRSTEWRWNLGGSWQPPSNAPGQGQSSRSSQAAPTDARSADRSRPARNSSGDMQRPWQRRRMLAGSPSEQEASLQSAANEPARSAAWEHSSAAVGTARQAESGSGHNSQQGWRRLLPRFLGQMMPGVQTARQDQRSERVEVPAVQSTGMQTDLSGQQEQAAPPSSTAGVGSEAADTAADAGWFVCLVKAACCHVPAAQCTSSRCTCSTLLTCST